MFWAPWALQPHLAWCLVINNSAPICNVGGVLCGTRCVSTIQINSDTIYLAIFITCASDWLAIDWRFHSPPFGVWLTCQSPFACIHPCSFTQPRPSLWQALSWAMVGDPEVSCSLLGASNLQGRCLIKNYFSWLEFSPTLSFKVPGQVSN